MPAALSQMEQQAEQVSIRSIPKVPTLCEECKSNPSKYKCPGCSIHSCSLPCVKAHKERTGCTGKRNRTQFVPLSQFDDNILLSDYNLLEEVKMVAESAQRMRTQLGMYAHFKLPHHLRSLQSAAQNRRTKLLFLPSGMSKREKNQSLHDQRRKFISWTIEWRFHSTNIVLHDHRVNENTSFRSILEKHLKPGPWNHQLRQFCADKLDHLKLFIRKYPKGPRSPFKELDMKAPIRKQLADIVILEFPVVLVCLPSHKINFEVIKDVNPSIHKPPKEDNEENKSLEGVLFREEAIADDNSSADPQVFDFVKHVESCSLHRVLTENMSSEKAPNGSSNKDLFEGDTASNLSLKTKESRLSKDITFEADQDLMDLNMSSEKAPNGLSDKDRFEAEAACNLSHSSLKTKEPKLFEDITFEADQDLMELNMSFEKAPNDSSGKYQFEGDTASNLSHSSLKTNEPKLSEDIAFEADQDLMDFYAELMDQMNPDDFFDFDSELFQKIENDTSLTGTCGVFLEPEELEEGEILE